MKSLAELEEVLTENEKLVKQYKKRIKDKKCELIGYIKVGEEIETTSGMVIVIKGFTRCTVKYALMESREKFQQDAFVHQVKTLSFFNFLEDNTNYINKLDRKMSREYKIKRLVPEDDIKK